MNEEKEEEKKVKKEVRVKEVGGRKYSKLSVWSESYKRMTDYLEQLNSQSKRTFSVNEILDHAISKLGSTDFVILQERYYTSRDRFQMLLEKVNKSGTAMSEDALLAKLMEQFDGEKKSRGSKAQKDLILE